MKQGDEFFLHDVPRAEYFSIPDLQENFREFSKGHFPLYLKVIRAGRYEIRFGVYANNLYLEYSFLPEIKDYLDPITL